MMRWLINVALRQRLLVLALAVMLVIFGVQAARQMPLDVFPEFAPPLVEIQTEAPGLSTEEVESLITMPLENAVNGTAWLKTLRSKSVLGLSSVVCIFQEGTDLMRARQLVQERIATITPRLPAVARAGDVIAIIVHQSGAEDWRFIEKIVADGIVRIGFVDHSPKVDGGAGCGQRGHLGAT